MTIWNVAYGDADLRILRQAQDDKGWFVCYAFRGFTPPAMNLLPLRGNGIFLIK